MADSRKDVIVVGAAGVGKTQLLQRFHDNTFSETYTSTMGCVCKNNLWEIAGHERYNWLLDAYFKTLAGAIICFDPDALSSHEVVDYWAATIKKKFPNTPVMLLAMKSDKVSLIDRAKTLSDKANQIGADLFFEVSSKNDVNVKKAFAALQSSAGLAPEPQINATDGPLRIYSAIYEMQKSLLKKEHAYNKLADEADVQRKMHTKEKHTRTAAAITLHNTYPSWNKPINYEQDFVSLHNAAQIYANEKSTLGMFKMPFQANSVTEIKARAKLKPHGKTATFMNTIRKN